MDQKNPKYADEKKKSDEENTNVELSFYDMWDTNREGGGGTGNPSPSSFLAKRG